MTRSRRHSPVAPWTRGLSEKADKQLANRMTRRVTRAMLKGVDDTPELPDRRELSDVWGWTKDGRRFWWPVPEGESENKWYGK